MGHAHGLTKQCNRRLPGVMSTVGLAQSLTLRFYHLRHMQGATVCYLTELFGRMFLLFLVCFDRLCWSALSTRDEIDADDGVIRGPKERGPIRCRDRRTTSQFARAKTHRLVLRFFRA